jgi:NADH dehydrogenase/NADH:ubiquinone oxidoreductase subunit G
MVKLVVDNREIQADRGISLLKACLDNEIYVPNLCYLEGMDDPPASCRLCFVEIEGYHDPVTSCTVSVEEGLVVQTDTPAVRRLQRTAFNLLLSAHELDCAHCPANKQCELQRIARKLGFPLKLQRLAQVIREQKVAANHPHLTVDHQRCVLCGRCVYLCRTLHQKPYLTFARRGIDTHISIFGTTDVDTHSCAACAVCVRNCPVGAISIQDVSESMKAR